VNGATIIGQDIRGQTADVTLANGLIALDGVPSISRDLNLSGSATFSGTSEVDVCRTLDWAGGRPSGAAAEAASARQTYSASSSFVTFEIESFASPNSICVFSL
jgi:hypothetical protein